MPTKQKTQKIRPSHQQQKQNTLTAMCVFSVVYLLLLFGVLSVFALPKTFLLWYLIIGMMSAWAYHKDKIFAQNNQSRTPENTLHFYDVLGGWVLASFAQKFLKHKTQKPSFRLKYYATVIVHIVLVMGAMIYLAQ